MDTQKARELLELERRRLQGILEGIAEEDQRPEPGDVPEQGADSAHLVFDREIGESIEEQARNGLAEIDAAFDRLAEGTYGICEIGGEPIPDARLEAMPAARNCVDHQAEVERRQAAGGYQGADPTI